MRESRNLDLEFAGLTIEDRADDGSWIVGYGAVYYDGSNRTEFELWPGMLERIMPGTFERALREGDDVRGLFNHDPNMLLGRTSSRTMKLVSDTRGLRYEIRTNPEDPDAMSVAAKLKRGDLSGSSFSFAVPPDGQRMKLEKRGGVTIRIREITNVDPLYDAGPVTFPAYEATAAGVRQQRDALEAAFQAQLENPFDADLDYRQRRNRLAS
jgi:HK97 family phage prohead protease